MIVYIHEQGLDMGNELRILQIIRMLFSIEKQQQNQQQNNNNNINETFSIVLQLARH